MHSGFCEEYVKSWGLTTSEFDFQYRTRPRAVWQQTTPEPVSISYIFGDNNDISCNLKKQYQVSVRQKHFFLMDEGGRKLLAYKST